MITNRAVFEPSATRRARGVPPQGWSPLFLALSALLLTGIWRLQSLIPAMATLRVPALAALAGYLLFFFDSRARSEAGRLTRTKLMKLAIAFLFMIALSVPFAISPGKAFAFLRGDHIKNFILMMMVAAAVRSLIDLQRLLGVLLGGSVVYAALEMRSPRYDGLGRLLMGGYYDANDFAFIMVITLPIMIYFLQRKFRPVVRIAALVGIALTLLVMVRSGSRGGFLGLMAVVVFMGLRTTAIPKRIRRRALTTLVVGLGILGSSQYWSLMQSMLNPSEDYNVQSDTGRIQVWKRGIGYMLDSPFVGVGAANFENAEGTSERAMLRMAAGIGTRWTSPHNSFVEVGAELGIFGLLIHIMMLVTSFQALRAVERRFADVPRAGPDIIGISQLLQAAFVGYIVSGFFLSQGFAAYLQVLYGLTMGLTRVAVIEAPAGAQVPSGRSANVPVRRLGLPRRSPV